MGYLLGLFILTVVGALYLWIGAAVAGITPRGFGKSFVATGVGMFASWIVGGALGLVGLKTGFVPFAIGLAVTLFIIKSVFNTTWGKAFVAWFVQVVAIIVSLAPFVLIFGAALLMNYR